MLVPRAGPFVQRNVVSRIVSKQCPGTVESVRFKSVKNQPPPQVSASQPGYITKRKGHEVVNKWRKRLPQYRTMPANQLTDEVYTGTEALKLPPFRGSIGHDHIGKPAEILSNENDPLRIFGVPKNLLLEFRLLSKPYMVVRQVTKEALDKLAAAKDTPSLADRWVFTGRPGCGKSFLLLQAVQHAIQRKWIVIYISRSVDLVNCTTNHIYDLRTQTYLQPKYAFQLLQRMWTVNKAAFENIYLQKEIRLEKQVIPAKTNLVKAIGIVLDERQKSGSYTSSPAVLEGVMQALEAQAKYPVLLAVDELQALYGKTLYRDQHFVPIHSYHLSMPRLIMEYVSGKRSFTRGAFMGAISTSQSTNPLPIELRDALHLDELDTRVVTDYDKRNRTMIQYTRGLKKLEVPEKLTLEEAVGIFEIWKGMKVFGSDQTFHDETFLGKYTESGGNPREFVRKGVLANFQV